jgi:hypothetical protein
MYEDLVKAGVSFCIIKRNGEVIQYNNLDDPEIIKSVVRLYNTANFVHESLKDSPSSMSITFNGKRIIIVPKGDVIQFAISSSQQDAGTISKSFGGV